MEAKKIGKIALSVLTVGVTVTVAYYGYKAIKKNIAKKKEAKQAALEAAEKEAKVKAAEAEAKAKTPA